jgi:hypothetical protein
LAGRSQAQMFEEIKAAFDKKELPALESGAMCYMMSKQGYLNDRDGHWHPHLMFFVPLTEPAAWGADLPGSPLIGAKDTEDRLTVSLLPVAEWSDGTAATVDFLKDSMVGDRLTNHGKRLPTHVRLCPKCKSTQLK